MLTASADLSAFHARRKRTTDELVRAMPRIVLKASTEGRDHAKAVGQFQDRSGDLRKSIEAIQGPSIARGASATIETDVPYAPYVEGGTRPHTIRPRRKRALRSRRASALRFEVGGEVIFARVVRHPGTKPYPFMGPAHTKAEAVGIREAEVAADRVTRLW